MTNEHAHKAFWAFAGRTVGVLWEDQQDPELGHYTRGELCGLRARPYDGHGLVLAFELRRPAPKDYLSVLIDVTDVTDVTTLTRAD